MAAKFSSIARTLYTCVIDIISAGRASEGVLRVHYVTEIWRWRQISNISLPHYCGCGTRGINNMTSQYLRVVSVRPLNQTYVRNTNTPTLAYRHARGSVTSRCPSEHDAAAPNKVLHQVVNHLAGLTNVVQVCVLPWFKLYRMHADDIANKLQSLL